MMLLDPVSHRGVALMGYNIIYHEGKLTASIVHTPQGIAEQRADKRRFLPYTQFRTDMVFDSLALFRAYGIPQVQIISAQNHPKVRMGAIPPERGYQIIDEVAWACGITSPDRDGNWIARLAS
jgi:hypothetical protein